LISTMVLPTCAARYLEISSSAGRFAAHAATRSSELDAAGDVVSVGALATGASTFMCAADEAVSLRMGAPSAALSAAAKPCGKAAADTPTPRAIASVSLWYFLLFKGETS
jgi:hypothetical protein